MDTSSKIEFYYVELLLLQAEDIIAVFFPVKYTGISSSYRDVKTFFNSICFVKKTRKLRDLGKKQFSKHQDH
jgi:hypothetical protein